jgi:hypothetical protein
VEWLKVYALSSNPTITKKKKRKILISFKTCLLVGEWMQYWVCQNIVSLGTKMLVLSETAGWQAHFLDLRVQKTISHFTLITSQPSLANSACLLRVIGFSHLLLKVRQMSFLPCGTCSWNWNPQAFTSSSEACLLCLKHRARWVRAWDAPATKSSTPTVLQ